MKRTGKSRQRIYDQQPASVYRLPIFKRGRKNDVLPQDGEKQAPYPTPDEGLQLQGLLIDTNVYLYDRASYDFLRFLRGYFGEYYRGGFDNPEQGSPQRECDDLEQFPPSPHRLPVASLNLFEAYFLNFICNSLEIWDGVSSIRISRQNLMHTFTERDSHFPYMFAVYAHLKRKRYTIKSGLKFGTDFVLYEYGPAVTHSLYAVHVLIPGIRDSGLAAIDAMQRASNSVKKDLLLVRVNSEGVSDDELMKPDCFAKMSVMEIIVRRRERLTSQAT
ncbi:hypothetical protein RvY_09624 [Ramazzottius varieornatus]|uniref:tRNA-intron lyase n=1 Tax=Ramazzottius varieornatus TaxID=947166 RepID=A0A1D1VCE5_RAMVA|nr:hypothetical protein RvY_09624 [Ramazzottius varieornatus]